MGGIPPHPSPLPGPFPPLGRRGRTSGAEIVEEIGEEEYDGAAVKDVIEKGESRRDICAAMFGFEEKHFADEAENMAAAFAGRQEKFDLVGEEQERDLVATAGCGNGKGTGDFGSELALGATQGTEGR